MSNISEQEQTQKEIAYQTFAEFLESSPPNQPAYISDLVDSAYSTVTYNLNTPVLQLHCPNESCEGIRSFRFATISSEGNRLIENRFRDFYVTYQCSNCQNQQRTFSLKACVLKNGPPRGICYKFGEFPPYGPPIPPRLIKLIGPDREEFLKGRRCENQGLGIGAFTYYRRVVENQKDRIFEQIIKVCEKIRAPQNKIDALREAQKEIQFSKALDMAKEVMPESLLIDGHNPVLLLYRALSRGVHELTDEECLQLASSIREVLGELSERLSAVLKDKAELTKAVSTLIHQKDK